MRYYAVYAACLVCVFYTMQYYNCGLFAIAIAIALRACYCVHIAIALWLFIVCAVGIDKRNNDK